MLKRAGWFLLSSLTLMLMMTGPLAGASFNPQEVGMVIENWLVDTDATVIGLANKQAGNTHGFTTFTYRSAIIGPPTEALPTVPLMSREEWQSWRGETRASISGDDYVIDYRGFLLDTRVSAGDDPTYRIRWESTWYKNDPLKVTPYATGSGTFNFDDPDFNFSIDVDPSNPSSVTIGGSASTKLWGVVDLTISGNKNTGTGILTASAGASVDIPLVSDLLGSIAEGKFTFEYNQKTGKYTSAVSGQVLFGLFSKQATVNSGRIAAPAKKQVVPVPLMPPVVRYRPVNVGGSQQVKMNGGLGAMPPAPGYRVPPAYLPLAPVFTTDPYNPFGALADTVMAQNPGFNTQVTNPSDIFESLIVHPGFLDPITFPDDDDPAIPPGGGLGFSFMDPTDPFPGLPAFPQGPGITLFPIEQLPIPEPSSRTTIVVVALIGLIGIGIRANKRAPRSRALPAQSK